MAIGFSGSTVRTRVIIFDTLAFIGAILIALVLAPALFSSNVHRTRTWFTLLAAWMVYSISYLLLIGRQIGPEPPFGLCMLQAALIYASTPLCGIGATCFAIDYYLQVSAVFRSTKVNQKALNILVILPFAVFITAFVGVLLVVQDPSSVQRDPNHFYCHITNPVPPLVNAIIIISAGAILFPLEAWTATILYRNWRAFKRLSPGSSRVSLSIFVRLAMFTSTAGLAVGLSAFITSRIRESVSSWSMLLPILPITAAFAFGTQRDIWNACMFWKRKTPVTPDSGSDSDNQSEANYKWHELTLES